MYMGGTAGFVSGHQFAGIVGNVSQVQHHGADGSVYPGGDTQINLGPFLFSMLTRFKYKECYISI